jgi:penicillin-binding protein-related factor A (putative recombinase)
MIPAWKQFENRIQTEANLNHSTMLVRIRDDVDVFRGKVIRRKSEFDFAASIDGQAVFFDAKVTQDQGWNLKEYILAQKKIHQWIALQDAFDKGAVAGYLIWFQQHDTIVWASVPCIRGLMTKGEKALTISSQGVSIQSVNNPINLQGLMFHEVYGGDAL